MRTLITLLLFIAWNSLLYSQFSDIKHFCDTNESGLKHGKYFMKYNDTILIEGFYNSGKRDSIWNFYNFFGQNIIKGYYNDGLMTNIWEYYKNNSIISQIEYQSDTLNGKACSFLPMGNPYLVYNYKDGILNGEIKLHRLNGTVKEQRYYINNLMDSLFLVFDKDGKELIKVIYKKGHPYSIIKSEKNNVIKLHFQGNLLEGNGKFKVYSKAANGNYYPIEERNYVNGKLNGKYVLYQNFVKKIETNFMDNYLTGTMKIYDSWGSSVKEKRKYTLSDYKGIEEIIGTKMLIDDHDHLNGIVSYYTNPLPTFLGYDIYDFTDSTDSRGVLMMVDDKRTLFDEYISYRLKEMDIQSKGKLFVNFIIGLTGEIIQTEVSSTLSREDNEKILNLFMHDCPNFEPGYKDGFPVFFKYTYNEELD